jgi:hypothetical protein
LAGIAWGTVLSLTFGFTIAFSFLAVIGLVLKGGMTSPLMPQVLHFARLRPL